MKKNFMPILLISSIIIINIITMLAFKEINIFGAIASIFGVISVTMSAKGHISCYYAGVINNIAYIYIAINSHFYGTVLLQGLFYLPMTFVGIHYWKKHLMKDSKIVNTRQMSPNKLLVLIICSVMFALLYSIILTLINGNLPLIDATITSLSLMATFLSIKRYKEQWLFWIVINIINICIWVIASFDNAPNGILMAITWSLYFINSIYGYINWHRLARRNEIREKN